MSQKRYAGLHLPLKAESALPPLDATSMQGVLEAELYKRETFTPAATPASPFKTQPVLKASPPKIDMEPERPRTEAALGHRYKEYVQCKNADDAIYYYRAWETGQVASGELPRDPPRFASLPPSYRTLGAAEGMWSIFDDEAATQQSLAAMSELQRSRFGCCSAPRAWWKGLEIRETDTALAFHTHFGGSPRQLVKISSWIAIDRQRFFLEERDQSWALPMSVLTPAGLMQSNTYSVLGCAASYSGAAVPGLYQHVRRI